MKTKVTGQKGVFIWFWRGIFLYGPLPLHPFDFKSVCTFSNWERIHPKTLTWLRSDKHTSPIITIRSKPITQIKYVLKCNFLCSKLPFLWALFRYKKDFLHSHLLTLTPFLKHFHFITFCCQFYIRYDCIQPWKIILILKL